jgi:hypothetical protein
VITKEYLLQDFIRFAFTGEPIHWIEINGEADEGKELCNVGTKVFRALLIQMRLLAVALNLTPAKGGRKIINKINVGSF